MKLVHPPEFELMPEIVTQAEANAKAARTSFEIVHDFDEGLAASMSSTPRVGVRC